MRVFIITCPVDQQIQARRSSAAASPVTHVIKTGFAELLTILSLVGVAGTSRAAPTRSSRTKVAMTAAVCDFYTSTTDT